MRRARGGESDRGGRHRHPRQGGQRRSRARGDHEVRDRRPARGVPDRPRRVLGEARVALEVGVDRRRNIGHHRSVARDRPHRAERGDPPQRGDRALQSPRSPRPAERHPGDVAVLEQVPGDRHALLGVPVRDVPWRLPRRVDDLQRPHEVAVAQRTRDPVARNREPEPGVAAPGIARVRLGLMGGDRQTQRGGATCVVGMEVRERDPRVPAAHPRTRAGGRSTRGRRCPCPRARRRRVPRSRWGLGGRRRRSPRRA